MCLLDLISIRTHQVIRELAVFLKPTHTCFPESPEHWWINWDRVEPETLYCQIQRNYHCCCSVVSDSVTPWIAALQASLSSTISWSLLRLMSIESVMPSNHLIPCCPLLLLPSIFPTLGSFTVSQLFAAGGQSIGASAPASILPMNIQGWFHLGLTGLISLKNKCEWKGINLLLAPAVLILEGLKFQLHGYYKAMNLTVLFSLSHISKEHVSKGPSPLMILTLSLYTQVQNCDNTSCPSRQKKHRSTSW